jgi:hypothetical protein
MKSVNLVRLIRRPVHSLIALPIVSWQFGISFAQMIDNMQVPNNAKAEINKSLADEIGTGRGDVMTPGSSVYISERLQDYFRIADQSSGIFGFWRALVDI